MATEHKNENLSVEERLKTLYKLQLIHSDIRRIRAIRGELPQEVKDPFRHHQRPRFSH